MPRGVLALWGRYHPAEEARFVDGVAREPPQELHGVHKDFRATLQLNYDGAAPPALPLERHEAVWRDAVRHDLACLVHDRNRRHPF